jgi:probable H4MPT-linked C1 transfer pathway protein
MRASSWLAFDVGGANIKVADGAGHASSRPFPLWKSPDKLARQLAEMIEAAPPCDQIVATMTGELADCFATKQEGVCSIVDSLCAAADNRPVWFYLTNGTLAEPTAAKEQYRYAAASNWHALAGFVARFARGENAILVDVGSTTCDVIPISHGKVVAQGYTDTERLFARELIYTGCERTPVCSLVSSVPFRNRECPVARELFATTLDVYLLLGETEERPPDVDTVDGRPATRDFALARMARCVCADPLEFNEADGIAMADYVATEQGEFLRDAIEEVLAYHGFGEETKIILSGHGDQVFQRAASGFGDFEGREVIRLASLIGAQGARVGPAYALAHLAKSSALIA